MFSIVCSCSFFVYSLFFFAIIDDMPLLTALSMHREMFPVQNLGIDSFMNNLQPCLFEHISCFSYSMHADEVVLKEFHNFLMLCWNKFIYYHLFSSPDNLSYTNLLIKTECFDLCNALSGTFDEKFYFSLFLHLSS